MLKNNPRILQPSCVCFSRHFRALRKIKKGEELLHSYLGREFLGSNEVDVEPVSHRVKVQTNLTNLLGHSVVAEIAPLCKTAVLQDFFAVTL